MNTIFKSSFIRDAKKTPPVLRPELDKAITIIENALSLKEIPNLKKLKGYRIAYRVKINNYRLCLNYENETITLARFLPRKEVIVSSLNHNPFPACFIPIKPAKNIGFCVFFLQFYHHE